MSESKWSVDNIADIKPAPPNVSEFDQPNEIIMDASGVLSVDTNVESFKDESRYLPIEARIDLDMEIALSKLCIDLREKGYKMYLNGVSPTKIAKDLHVTKHLINYWIKDGGWAERLRVRNDTLEIAVKESVRGLRLERADEESRESLDIGKGLRKRVKTMVDNEDIALTPANLNFLASAAKSTSDLGARGMGESTEAAQKETKTEKQPLVIMIGGGGLPPVRRVVIDNETGKEITE